MCFMCPHTNIIEDEPDDSLLSDTEYLKSVLVEYGIADDFDMIGEEDILKNNPMIKGRLQMKNKKR